MTQVEQLMNYPAIVCRQQDSAMLAAALMLEHDCGAIPIVDEFYRLVGILTDRDVCMAAYTESMPLRDISIFDIMTRHVLTCSPEDSLRKARRLMERGRVRRLPVVNAEEQVIGILSATDLLGERERVPDAADPLRPEELVKTLATVSRARRLTPHGQVRSVRPSL